MDFNTFQVYITPLAMHFREVRDEPTWRLYHAALLAPPTPSPLLLDRALIRAANRRFFPSTEELRADAEAERQALLKAHPYVPCTVCRDSDGWVAFTDDAGVARVRRCGCFQRYREALARLGVTGEPVSVALAVPSELTP